MFGLNGTIEIVGGDLEDCEEAALGLMRRQVAAFQRLQLT
jgi:hypothetical protein